MVIAQGVSGSLLYDRLAFYDKIGKNVTIDGYPSDGFLRKFFRPDVQNAHP